MPLFQCEVCGCIENTALAAQGCRGERKERFFDWSYALERKGLLLCSLHAPTHYNDGTPTKFGKWHDVFEYSLLPLGEYETDPDTGGLRHKTTKVPLKLR